MVGHDQSILEDEFASGGFGLVLVGLDGLLGEHELLLLFFLENVHGTLEAFSLTDELLHSVTYLLDHVLHCIFGVGAQLELAAGIARGQDLIAEILYPQHQFPSATLLYPLEIHLQTL